MSHCCGGCGGDDPLMKNKETGVQGKDEKESSEKTATETKPLTAETWQPDKK